MSVHLEGKGEEMTERRKRGKGERKERDFFISNQKN